MATKQFNPLEYGAKPVTDAGGFDPFALGAVQIAAPEPAKKPGLFSMNTLKGETTYKANEGGATSIPGNLLRTAGNLPSSAASLTRATISPVNPLDTESPINIGGNIVRSAVVANDIFKDRGFVQGSKDIVKGTASTLNKIFRAPGEFIVGQQDKKLQKTIDANLDRTRIQLTDMIVKKKAAGADYAKEMKLLKEIGLGEVKPGDASSPLTTLAKVGIEDPFFIPSLLYAGPEAAGSKSDLIQRTAQVVTRGADTSIPAVTNKVKNVVGAVSEKATAARSAKEIAAREAELLQLEKSYAKTRKAMDFSADANNASRKRIAETDVLVGAADNEGVIRTKQPGGAVDQYRTQTLDDSEGVVRNLLEREGKSVAPEVIRNKMVTNIMDSGLEGKALQNAIKNIEGELEGLALRAEQDGRIPLAFVHDAKIATTNGINYMTEPFVKAERKALARAFKEVVEDTSEEAVKAINKELQKYLKDIELLESLDGMRTKNGRLGKLFIKGGGFLAGSAAGGLVGGPIGAVIGSGVGGEVASRMAARSMRGTFGKATGNVAPRSEVIEGAVAKSRSPRLMLPAPKEAPASTLFVTPKGKVTPLMQEAQDVAAVERRKAKTSADFRRVKKVEQAPDPYVPERELPVIEAGKKPKAKGTEIDKIGAPKVYAPERVEAILKKIGKEEAIYHTATGRAQIAVPEYLKGAEKDAYIKHIVKGIEEDVDRLKAQGISIPKLVKGAVPEVKKYTEAVVRSAAKKLGLDVDEIHIVGSTATGKNTLASDIDVVVKFKNRVKGIGDSKIAGAIGQESAWDILPIHFMGSEVDGPSVMVLGKKKPLVPSKGVEVTLTARKSSQPLVPKKKTTQSDIETRNIKK